MSQEDVAVMRKPLRVRERSSRTLDQRLFLRFPRLADTFARLLAKLPPTSRPRQVVMWRGVRLSVEAFSRRDLDVFSYSRHPRFEFEPPRERVDAGFMEPAYRGAAGYHEYVSEWSEVWGDHLRVEPVDLIDLGDRIVVLYNVPVRARASGVPLIGELATVAVLKDGKAIRQHDYLHHAEALEAVGLWE